jgi:tripartite-type tricarboxylate transporter receptor subunit TctC
MISKTLRGALALAFTLGLPLTAVAQPYPSKPIRVVVPFAPGGNVDITARTVAPILGEILGQPVVVENRAGAGGMVGAGAVMSSPADGYTLMMGSNSTVSVGPSLYPNWPYDPVKGVTPISNLAIVPFVLVVKNGLNVSTFADFMRLAREKPGTLGMASGGQGSSNHLVGELFQSLAGVKFVHIPYKGAGAALVDVVSGQVDMLFDQASASIGHVRTGKLRALAVSSRSRWPSLPDTPTFGESGVNDFVLENVTGLVAPAGTPAAIVQQLHAASVRALANPLVKERFAQLGVEAVGSTPEQFAAFIRDDLARWSKVIKSAGIKVE